mgnify:CR=1 FL=1
MRNIIKENDKLTGTVVPKTQSINLEKDTLISMNCWFFNTDIFSYLEQEICRILKSGDINSECFLPTVVMKQIEAQQKKVSVLKTTDHWFGITYQADTQIVNEKIDAIFTN